MTLLNDTGSNANEDIPEKPLVTVGIPTYNRPDGLRNVLECITGQTYKNLEILVSDNCSPGTETEAVVREFMETDSRIRYFRQESNHGATWNFEYLLSRSSAEYFMWVADDDVWDSAAIGSLVNYLLDHPESSVAMSGCKRVDLANNLHDIVRNFNSSLDINRSGSFRLALDASTNAFWTYLFYGLFRTTFIKKIYHDIPEVFGFDVIFTIHVLLSTNVGYIPELLYIRKVHVQSTAERYEKEELGKRYADPLKYYRLIFASGPVLLKSDILSLKRKLQVPAIVIYMFVYQILFDIRRYSLGAMRKIGKCCRERN